jgi:hypothetical protein
MVFFSVTNLPLIGLGIGGVHFALRADGYSGSMVGHDLVQWVLPVRTFSEFRIAVNPNCNSVNVYSG